MSLPALDRRPSQLGAPPRPAATTGSRQPLALVFLKRGHHPPSSLQEGHPVRRSEVDHTALAPHPGC